VPQLPPVAAAAFVITLLTVILVTTVIVQVRARRRRMLLAEMVRATAPIPRPAVSSVAPAPLEASLEAALMPLRGNDYGRAEREARFRAFDERAPREAAPGRPGRRLAAQVAHAAAASAPAPVVEPERALPVVAVVEPLQAPEAVAPVEVAAAPVELAPAPPPVIVPAPAAPIPTHGGMASIGLDFAGPVVLVSAMPLTDSAPATVEVTLDEPAGAERDPEPEVAPVLAEVVATAPPTAERTSETLREAIREAVREPAPEPLREPRVTVLAPRQVAPALPALMTRELTLGDAARALRNGLTMTDGRQLRRAVAVGAATSVVAAAFAIRGRKR
jgi:hypothetical protein